MNKFIRLCSLSILCSGSLNVPAQVMRGEISPGLYANVSVDSGGKLVYSGLSGIPSVISTSNSSTVLLGIGGVFTGATEDITQYAEVRVSVFSDVASATDGLQLQQSKDGINWDASDVYTIPSATNKTYGSGAVS